MTSDLFYPGGKILKILDNFFCFSSRNHTLSNSVFLSPNSRKIQKKPLQMWTFFFFANRGDFYVERLRLWTLEQSYKEIWCYNEIVEILIVWEEKGGCREKWTKRRLQLRILF